MTKIFLIRHAEAEGNLFRRAHGQFDGKVTPGGYKQILCLDKRFKNEHVDAVFSSDLFRARVTAESVSKQNDIEIITDKRLREVNIGEWEDLPWGEIEHNWSEMCENFNSDPEKWSVIGSESNENVCLRMTEFFTEIAPKYEGKTIAVFSHGFAIRSYLCSLFKIPSSETYKVPYCDNTAAALLIFDEKNITAEYHGDNSHLSDDISTFARQSWWRGEGERRRENLRYMQFDKHRDETLLQDMKNETGEGEEGNIILTAILQDDAAGILILKAPGEFGVGRIMNMYIKPELRRRGFGCQLIGEAISVCRRMGLKKLRAETKRISTAGDILQKCGFISSEEVGEKCVFERNLLTRNV